MVLNDYLTPVVPGLIYESQSERSQSPNSNQDLNLSAGEDWLSWNSLNEASFTIDSTFIANDDISLVDQQQQQLGLEEILTFSNDMTEESKKVHEFETIQPELLVRAHNQNASSVYEDVQNSRRLPPSNKRKLSFLQEETALESPTRGVSGDKCNLRIASNQSLNAQSMQDDCRASKISHNVIEKRYRSNLNDKIITLRDAVPILKTEAESGSVKHPKGRIIQGATDYIQEIEAKCARLRKENEALTAKLHGESTSQSGGTLSKVVVGGLAGMMCASTSPTSPSVTSAQFTKRAIHDSSYVQSFISPGTLQNVLAVVKMLLLVAAVLYIYNPNIFNSRSLRTGQPIREKYSQSALDDTMQEDIQESREALYTNVSAMLEMPCDRPSLLKRILQGCFVLFIELVIGQHGWSTLVHRSLDYAQRRQSACKTLIETQLLGGDKHINQAKLFLSAIQSLGYSMPREMRALHFAMVCHGYAPVALIQRCITMFWSAPSKDAGQLLGLPMSELFSQRVLEAMWAWTNCLEDPLIANVRNDETINCPLKQLSSIHAALLQNQILRAWLRGVESASELEEKTNRLLLYAPEGSKIMTNSQYLKSMIEPSDWLEQAMLSSIESEAIRSATTSSHEVAMQLRCCVLLNLLEKSPSTEEVSDILQMAEFETSSILPGYSSRIVAKCIAKHRLDDDEGISEALRRICAKIGGSTREMDQG